ncbi:hypothetical protein ABE38_06045 [Brevibacillus agri]|nr:hypothetical protein [Brevibacillus agri]
METVEKTAPLFFFLLFFALLRRVVFLVLWMKKGKEKRVPASGMEREASLHWLTGIRALLAGLWS